MPYSEARGRFTHGFISVMHRVEAGRVQFARERESALRRAQSRGKSQSVDFGDKETLKGKYPLRRPPFGPRKVELTRLSYQRSGSILSE